MVHLMTGKCVREIACEKRKRIQLLGWRYLKVAFPTSNSKCAATAVSQEFSSVPVTEALVKKHWPTITFIKSLLIGLPDSWKICQKLLKCYQYKSHQHNDSTD